ncbi:MAG: hypothetical protein ACEQSX_13825 [Baekduiaceae bacterium]
MREQGLSQTGAFKQLGAALGLGPESRSAFLPYLYNKPVTDDYARALSEIVGWPPEEDAPAPTTDEPSLARAIIDLTAELRAMREERAQQGERIEALERAVRALQGGAATLPARRAPLGTAE